MSRVPYLHSESWSHPMSRSSLPPPLVLPNLMCSFYMPTESGSAHKALSVCAWVQTPTEARAASRATFIPLSPQHSQCPTAPQAGERLDPSSLTPVLRLWPCGGHGGSCPHMCFCCKLYPSGTHSLDIPLLQSHHHIPRVRSKRYLPIMLSGYHENLPKFLSLYP